MKRALLAATAALGLWGLAAPAQAFCGFYVAKADAKLFNKASKVVVARSGERTVVTMASDYQGDPKEFAVVVPVPSVIKKQQVHITDNALVDHVDAYSAPRLVEYHDPDPCNSFVSTGMIGFGGVPPASRLRLAGGAVAKSLGVTIEAEYSVGEYDIQILSAQQSDGLETFLVEGGYKLPPGAAAVLGSYLKQDMKFFVAKVNLEAKEKLGTTYLRPIQVAYETHKFMLPIRLGTVNADGPQELFVFMLTEKGRVETTNYRTVRIPSDVDVPLYTRAEFPTFYRAMFDTQVTRDDMRAVYLEYAWNMGWCDPCAADPIPNDKLVELGAFWLQPPTELIPPEQPPQPAPDTGQGPDPWANTPWARNGSKPKMPPPRPPVLGRPMPMAQQVFITRLHVRYDASRFPEDLMFQETADISNFQGRYVLNHPYTGPSKCEAMVGYRKSLRDRFESEAGNLARLTGWDIAAIRARMEKSGQSFAAVRDEDWKPAVNDGGKAWYEEMWQGRK